MIVSAARRGHLNISLEIGRANIEIAGRTRRTRGATAAHPRSSFPLEQAADAIQAVIDRNVIRQGRAGRLTKKAGEMRLAIGKSCAAVAGHCGCPGNGANLARRTGRPANRPGGQRLLDLAAAPVNFARPVTILGQRGEPAVAAGSVAIFYRASAPAFDRDHDVGAPRPPRRGDARPRADMRSS